MRNMYIGIDIGSISVKIVTFNEKKELLSEKYVRHNGHPYYVAFTILSDICNNSFNFNIAGIAVTGSGGHKIAELLGGIFVNEIISHTKAITAYYPDVRTVIEIGGEESKLLLFDYDEKLGSLALKDFSMNDLCAAGTGSFLDQQASRLGVSIEEEFGQLALKSKKPPRIAGRCSVFAKSDMIHLQQIATPHYDIIAGLCFAFARNFKSTVGKGKEFVKPIAFQGGVAANAGMVRAFEETLVLQKDELIIPEHYKSMGAMGAILTYMDSPVQDFVFEGLQKLEYLLKNPLESENKLEHLSKDISIKELIREGKIFTPSCLSNEKIEAFLGIDVGSVSTNVVAIDKKGNVLSKRYLPTAGRPIQAVQQGLEEVGAEIENKVAIRGVGTTGSGRYLIGDLVGADLIKNEITAQATAAIKMDPTVDTIFEIGGQDSKYISIENGAITDFEMNKVCAAGTGSFLEEQAERLDINIKNDFGAAALNSESPIPLGDRCTVFMESDLVHHQQKGALKENLVAGLAYSIVHNYLNKVVGDKPVGKNIFFQGGVAANHGVVAAFSKVCGKKVTVPPHHDVTGAIGVALLARDKSNGHSNFKGFDFSNRKYDIKSFECKECANHCEIRMVKVENEEPLFYGSRCEKYDVKRESQTDKKLPDLFGQREELLFKDYFAPKENTKGTIGIPLMLSFWETLPFWKTLFQQLGFNVKVTDKTNKDIIHNGVENVVAETCFPIKVAHGHILKLLEEKLDYIFIPSIINMGTPEYGEKDRSNFNCPYVQTIPYVTNSALNFDNYDVKIINPVIYMQRSKKTIEKALMKELEKIGCKSQEIQRALTYAYNAQEEYNNELSKIGKEILSNLKENDKAIVIVSRPYNGYDKGINLDLPKKLLNLGVLPIPIDMLPLDEVPLQKHWIHMYWRYGQRILKSAKIVRDNPNLYALYITNFSCGPDSFITRFFKEEMGGKPYLQIEIDEHSADAGVITRCEAFLDTIENLNNEKYESIFEKRSTQRIPFTKDKTVYLPYMGDHSSILAAAMRCCGIKAESMAPSNNESIYWGKKYTSEKECYPALLTIGDMIRQIKSPDFEPEKSAFFMAAADGPCRFGQYNVLHRLVLDELGYKDIPVFVLDQDREYHNTMDTLGGDFPKIAWQGIVALDIINKMLLETRPYEVNNGECDAIYKNILKQLIHTVENRRDIFAFMKSKRNIFNNVETIDKGTRPIVGIVGEIYVRSNEFSNNYLIKTIEDLGGEAAVPTIAEWINYTTYMRKIKDKELKNYIAFTKDSLVESFMHSTERKFYEIFDKEPDGSTEELFKYARKYLSPTFEGEAILTVGKAIELIKKENAIGIINTMPFTCMPGTIVAALLKGIRKDFNEIPMINMFYTGQQSTSIHIKLEAFMHQIKNYFDKLDKDENLVETPIFK